MINRTDNDLSPRESLKRGFRSSHPIVLILAIIINFFIILPGIESFFTSGTFINIIPRDLFIWGKNDDWNAVVYRVHQIRRNADSGKVGFYIIGGSCARESIKNTLKFEKRISKEWNGKASFDVLASSGQTLLESVFLIENLPENKGLVILGVNPWTFTKDISRPFYSFLPEQPEIMGKYLYSIEEGGFNTVKRKLREFYAPQSLAFIKQYFMKRMGMGGYYGPIVYERSRYSKHNIFSSRKKNKLLNKFVKERIPEYFKNSDENIAALEDLILTVKRKNLKLILIQMPYNFEIMKNSLDIIYSDMDRLIIHLAEKHDFEYLQFNKELYLPNSQFRDLYHMVGESYEEFENKLFGHILRIMK